MSGPGRPWWVPLLGVGSFGLGGFQALGGLAMAIMAAETGGAAGTVFIVLAGAWFVPGVLLAASGAGVVAGTRWGRGLSLAAVGAMLLALGIVGFHRRSIPAAVADLVVYAEKDSKGLAADAVKKGRAVLGEDPVSLLRDPEQASISAWVFTLYCGCGMPWYLLVLLVCGLPMGRRIATPGPSGGGRTGAP